MANEHTHYYGGSTMYYEGYVHVYSGETSASPDTLGHIHYLGRDTTTSDSHFHNYVIATGPPIYVSGGHYHRYRGYTSVADGHVHLIEGLTSIYSEQ